MPQVHVMHLDKAFAGIRAHSRSKCFCFIPQRNVEFLVRGFRFS